MYYGELENSHCFGDTFVCREAVIFIFRSSFFTNAEYHREKELGNFETAPFKRIYEVFSYFHL